MNAFGQKHLAPENIIIIIFRVIMK